MISLEFSQAYGLSEVAHAQGVTEFLWQDGTLYAVSRQGLSALSISQSGAVTPLDDLAFGFGFAPGSEPALAHWPDAGAGTLLIGGQGPWGLQAIELAPGGGFGAAVDLGSEPGVLRFPQVVGEAGAAFLVSGVHNSDGLRVFDLPASGPPVQVAELADSAALALADVSATAVAGGASPYLLAASATEDQIGAFRVNPDGSLTPTGVFGAAQGIGMDAPAELITVTSGGDIFAIAGGRGSSSLSVLRLTPEGALRYADHIVDSLGTRFQSVDALDAIDVGGRIFVAAGGADDGISLFTLAPNGRLIHLQSVANGPGMTLDAVSAVTLAVAGNTLQVLAAGQGTPGITRLEADLSELGMVLTADPGGEAVSGGALNDLLSGGEGDDVLSGLAGDDILIDGGGSDVLTGGEGADLFMLDADGVTDRITDFEPGLDRLDLSSFGLLYSPDQLSVTPTDDGAVIRFRDEEIVLTTADGTPLSVDDLTPEDIVNVDRPAYLPTPEALDGTEGPDILTGGLAADLILGRGGDDLLAGGAGDDTIIGGPGDDRLDGGDGNDWLSGGDAAPQGPSEPDWFGIEERLRAVADLGIEEAETDPPPDFLF